MGHLAAPRALGPRFKPSQEKKNKKKRTDDTSGAESGRTAHWTLIFFLSGIGLNMGSAGSCGRKRNRGPMGRPAASGAPGPQKRNDSFLLPSPRALINVFTIDFTLDFPQLFSMFVRHIH